MLTKSYLELLDRANQAEQIAKADWDYEKIMMNTRRLVERYDLRWDKKSVVNSDLALADRVFAAGKELIETTGIYYINTGRMISFSRSEIEYGIQNMPQRLVLGEGSDAHVLIPRSIQDPHPPSIWAGNPGAPTPEELFLPSVMSWMKEPLVDMATCGSLTHVDGREVHTGEPTEILATRRELSLLREGLRRVGRPGMGLLAAQSSVSELGDLAAAHPDYLRPCDAHLVPMLNELMFDQKNLARVVNSLDYGMINASLPTVMVGGLAGDAPGAAIVQTASFIAASLVCRAHYHILHPIHIRHIATSTRSVMWVQSVVSQAFARNAPCIIVADIYPKSGALTRELLYEVAANAIAATISGAHLEGPGSADGALPNSTGLECRWMGEVGHAVARQGMDQKSANYIINELLGRYEFIFRRLGGNPGVSFDQAYDMGTLTPRPEWQQLYDEVKTEVRQMGLELEAG